MTYIPISPKERDAMLETIGVESLDNLFEAVPAPALTEMENKDTLDAFANTLIQIADEAKTNPEIVKSAPNNTQFGRMDEVKAARELVLCCWLPEVYKD